MIVQNCLTLVFFQELKDVAYFNKVMVCDGTVAWPNEQDICPDTIYIDSVKNT